MALNRNRANKWPDEFTAGLYHICYLFVIILFCNPEVFMRKINFWRCTLRTLETMENNCISAARELITTLFPSPSSSSFVYELLRPSVIICFNVEKPWLSPAGPWEIVQRLSHLFKSSLTPGWWCACVQRTALLSSSFSRPTGSRRFHTPQSSTWQTRCGKC